MTLTRLEEAALPQGVWGKRCKILRSHHFLALNMMTKNPTFSTKNQAFKKLIEKQKTENRISHPAMIDLEDGTQYNLHLDQISNQTIP